MKKIILFSLVALAACNSKTSKVVAENDSTSVKAEVKLSKADSAKMMLDSADFYMVKGIKKEISEEVTREKIHPFMEQFQKLYAELSPADTLKVHQYRVNGVNKLIDLQIAESNK